MLTKIFIPVFHKVLWKSQNELVIQPNILDKVPKTFPPRSTFITDYQEGLTEARDFLDGSVGKESTCNAGDAGDMGSIPGSGRSPGGGHDDPLQCSGLDNPMDRGACWGVVQWIAKSWTY